MKKKPLVDIAAIEKNPPDHKRAGHCRPAILRRAIYNALGAPDKDVSALFYAMQKAGIKNIPRATPENLFANSHMHRDWAEAIATTIGVSVYALYPQTFIKPARTKKATAPALRTRPTMLSNDALEMLGQKIRERGGFTAVAKSSGLSKTTIWTAMRSFGSPRFLTIATLCAHLDVSLDAFSAACGIKGGKK